VNLKGAHLEGAINAGYAFTDLTKQVLFGSTKTDQKKLLRNFNAFGRLGGDDTVTQLRQQIIQAEPLLEFDIFSIASSNSLS
jgi:hypothetical protein